MRQLLLISSLLLMVIVSGCTNVTDEVPDFEELVQNEENGPPTIYDIGINLEPYDSETGFAGDVAFDGLTYDNKVFTEFGGDMDGGSLNVHPMFVIPLGTEIHAVSDGIARVSELDHGGDYDVCVQRDDNDEWCISYEHVQNLRIKDGDTVIVGQIIGEAGTINEFTDSGKFDLKIWKGGVSEDDILNYCPYALFDETVNEEKLEKLSRFISDWEEFIGEDVYDEDSWHSPGCVYEKMYEGAAMRGEAG